MEFRSLGKNRMQVSALGLGCMGMSFAYGPANDEESLQVLHRYLELGGNFLDTAEVYGPYKNEELLGRFLRSECHSRMVQRMTRNHYKSFTVIWNWAVISSILLKFMDHTRTKNCLDAFSDRNVIRVWSSE